MPQYFTPGVYVEEFEMGGKPIAGVSTSIVGFVGKVKGPLKKNADGTVVAVLTPGTLTGTANTYVENHLIDNDVSFTNVRVGDVVTKTTAPSATAKVTSVNSEHDLTLSDNIFTAGTEAYSIAITTIVPEYVDITPILNKPTLITSWGQFVDTFGRYDATDAKYLPQSVFGFFANGGTTCYVVAVATDTAADYLGHDNGPEDKTGLYALDTIDEVSIVCIPGIVDKNVQKAMITHCTLLKDRFCILDPDPAAKTIAQIKAQKDELISDDGYGALYYPQIKVPVETVTIGKKKITKNNVEVDVAVEKIGLTEMFVAPSGYMAGIYARSDTNVGVHKAPANEVVMGALELEIPFNKAEQGLLNPYGVDCIRSFPGRGIRVWGARTISSDTLWQYINVRRLFIFLEESIDKGTQWAVFEPNDEKLWARVKQTITQFLTTVWRDGALMGAVPEEAFFVQCDRTTMTQDDIDQGRLICIIGVAPVKPAEFVIFRIAQWRDK